MIELIYKTEFYSDWHCGSGLSSGAEADLLVLKDRSGLPIIPGKTLKGLLRDSAQSLEEFGGVKKDFVSDVFGSQPGEDGDSSAGSAYFSNASLSLDMQKILSQDNGKKKLLYRNISSTAIEKNGQAKEYSLRTIEVCIPLVLFAKITGLRNPQNKLDLIKCMQMVKRLGTGRHRGLGRCDMTIMEDS